MIQSVVLPCTPLRRSTYTTSHVAVPAPEEKEKERGYKNSKGEKQKQPIVRPVAHVPYPEGIGMSTSRNAH